MEPFIRLDAIVREKSRLTYRFSTSLDLFHKNSFFIEYSSPLGEVSEAVAAIPFAAVMAPIAWASGASLEIPVLDEAYGLALERCRHYFTKWFSKSWSFARTLRTRLVETEALPSRTAMLFSGGVDSLCTYIGHKEKNPLLYTVFGADIPLSHTDFIRLCRSRFDEFARNEGVSLTYIYTDVREIYRLERFKPFSSNWYGEVAHGLLLSSLVAPVGYGTVDRLVLASCSHRPGSHYSCGSDKPLVEEIRWAGTRVESDSRELSRCEKIRAYLKPNPEYLRYVRVCWMQFESLNCGRCEKCLRTICELLLNGVDPALCNFKIDGRTLPALKKRMLNDYYVLFRSEMALDFWRTIQENIPAEGVEDRYGAAEFFAWFARFDKIKEKQNPALQKLATHFINFRTFASKQLKPAKAFLARQEAAL